MSEFQVKLPTFQLNRQKPFNSIQFRVFLRDEQSLFFGKSAFAFSTLSDGRRSAFHFTGTAFNKITCSSFQTFSSSFASIKKLFDPPVNYLTYSIDCFNRQVSRVLFAFRTRQER